MSALEAKPAKKREYFHPDHLSVDLKKHALRGAGAVVFFNMSAYGIQMIGTIILARLLAPDDFGLISMVTAFSLLLQNFGVNGFTEAIIQRKEINHKLISTLFWINFVLSLALTLLLMALAPFISGFYKEPRLVSITIAIASSVIFAGLSTHHLALMKRNMHFYGVSAIQVSATLLSVILAIALTGLGWGYWALVARRIALPLATAVGAWILCSWRPGLPALRTGVKAMLRFAINTYGNFTVNYFSRNLDKMLIGWRFGTQSLGFYDRAYHLFSMSANQLTHPVTSVAVAALSRLCNNPERYRRYYIHALSMIAFVGMPISAMLFLIANDLTLLLLGPQWNKTGQILSIFAASLGIMLLYSTHGWLHLSLGRPDRWFRWGIIAFVVTTLSFLVGLPFGILGVTIAYTVSFYLLIGPGLWYASRPINLKFAPLVSEIWRYCLCAVGAGFLCWYILYSVDWTSAIFLELNVFIRIIVSFLLCGSVYLLLIIVAYQSVQPISQFKSVLREMVPKSKIGSSKKRGVGG
ncbi:lipopolysaccharide biosynthesis protein [candidate division KSB1 bacterium]|nr:lipopolysaccharide biosynthesis protein [candidate division KSB1 bacterium]NIV70230.1 oligosaccharide flippase family protein [Phycisphaerae bacterium]NIR71118.1 lipopolysaccharide biosynthesis protein [candidate division KSB1 bacterium]NIS26134.1 lipopolysaccharide biosynthesis protein [candidate division KSB1 bacterium]NIT74280.1 lipopolysaccharide biosynthesis protein [candidate division KSB1 bacterium]